MIADLKPYPEYRTAEGGWVGEIPKHWAVRRMKYALREIDSRSTTGKEQLLRISQYTGVTQRRAADGSDEADTRASSLVGYKRVKPDDLVINIMLAWNGSMGVSRFDGIASPAYCVYRFGHNVHPWYFHYLLRSSAYKARIKASSTGVVESRLRLYSDDLGRIEALLPPPEEQAAIVHFLDWANGRLERAIRSKRKVIVLLNEQKQAIIHRAITRGLDLSASRKDSGIPWIGEIPAHWQLARLKNVLSRNDGGVWGTDFADDGTIVLRSTEQAVDGEWRIRNPARIRLPDSAVATTRLEEGDLLITKSSGSADHIGKTSLVTEQIAAMGCCYSNFMQRLRLKGTVNPKFIATLLNSRTGRQHYRVSSTSTTGLGNLTATVIGNLPFGLPPSEEQSEIVEYLADALSAPEKSISTLASEIALLHEFRMRLVADVVTGKLDIRDAAARLPDEAPADDSAHDTNLLAVDEQDEQEAAS